MPYRSNCCQNIVLFPALFLRPWLAFSCKWTRNVRLCLAAWSALFFSFLFSTEPSGPAGTVLLGTKLCLCCCLSASYKAGQWSVCSNKLARTYGPVHVTKSRQPCRALVLLLASSVSPVYFPFLAFVHGWCRAVRCYWLCVLTVRLVLHLPLSATWPTVNNNAHLNGCKEGTTTANWQQWMPQKAQLTCWMWLQHGLILSLIAPIGLSPSVK